MDDNAAGTEQPLEVSNEEMNFSIALSESDSKELVVGKKKFFRLVEHALSFVEELSS